MKTNKSYTKRLKLTKNGKVIARTAGQNHFNAKVSSRKRLNKKHGRAIVMTNKMRSRFIPFN